MSRMRVLILALVLVAVAATWASFGRGTANKTLVLPAWSKSRKSSSALKSAPRQELEALEGAIAEGPASGNLRCSGAGSTKQQAEARLQAAQFDLQKLRSGHTRREGGGSQGVEAARERYKRVKAVRHRGDPASAQHLKSNEADLQLAEEKFDRAKGFTTSVDCSRGVRVRPSNRDRLRNVVNRTRSYLDQLLKGSRDEDTPKQKPRWNRRRQLRSRPGRHAPGGYRRAEARRLRCTPGSRSSTRI